jgi:hypothetical protein
VAAAAALLLAAGSALASPAADSTQVAADSTRVVAADSTRMSADSSQAAVAESTQAVAADTTQAAVADSTQAAVADSTQAAVADSTQAVAADSTRLPADAAWIGVRTKPPGLRIRIGNAEAGRSPVEHFQISAGRLTVRAFPEDPRLFDSTHGQSDVDVAPGETIRVEFDLRALAVVQSVPISNVSRVSWRESVADSLLGATPIRLPPALLESNSVRFSAIGYADSVVLGPSLLAQAGGKARRGSITLRPVELPPTAPPPRPSLFRRKWFAWTLVGAGALITGGAVVIRNEADDSYARYMAASDPRVIEDEYDRTIQYDHYAAGALIGGQALFTTGLLLLVTGTSK